MIVAALYSFGWRVVSDPSGKGYFIGRRVTYRNGQPAGKNGLESPSPLQSIELMTPDPVIRRNLDSDAFIVVIKSIADAAERVLTTSPRRFPLKLTVILHPDRETDNVIEVADPADGALAQSLADEIERIDKDLRTKTDDVSVRLHFIAGKPLSGPAAPSARYPRLSDLKAMAELRLDRYASTFQNVDPKFAGVIAFGKALGERRGKDIDALALKNPDFWRALMEMVPQDPSVGFSLAYLYASRGLLAAAQAWLLISAPEMDTGPFGGDLDQLKGAITLAEAEVGLDIKKGIALHDEKRYDEAMAAYDGVLAGHGENAWALYEKSFSMLAKDAPGSKGAREELYKTIRDIDPFYFEAYQGKVDAARKAQIVALLTDVHPFLKGPGRSAKAYERFAYGCEAMGQHHYAEQVFWKLYVNRRDAPSLAHFRSNLSSLGMEGLANLFKDTQPKGGLSGERVAAPAPETFSPPAQPDYSAVVSACAAEAGMLCSEAAGRPADSAACLLRQERRGLRAACRKSLKQLEANQGR